MKIRDLKTIEERRKFIEKEQKLRFEAINIYPQGLRAASINNCENMIGAVSVPLGVAGPLKVVSCQFSVLSEYYIPLATTEGALVASVARGCKAITKSGGATVDSHRVGPTRGPVFRVTSLAQHDRLYTYLTTHLDELKKVAEKTSHHLKLIKLLTRGVGRYRYVRFVFDTTDAMGMNMVTIATQALVKFIEGKTGVSCLSIAGNFDIDKKPSWLNAIENRGMKVWAETTLSSKVITDILKTSAQKIYEVWLSKCMIGSAISGSLGFNAQFSNVVAAIFLSTGQDIGHVSEGSIGITTTEIIGGKDLYISVCLPDLMVGTVGGGTGLPSQKEALEILGVAGGNEGKNAQMFAEIVGAAVLAGEISLLSSLSEGSLASAHQKLARTKLV